MRNFLILLVLVLPSILLAQTQLTLKSAIDTALVNNFDIRIAKQNVEIGKTNNSFGMAGGLPTVTAGGTDNQSFNNIDQKFESGQEISLDNVSTNALNANATASIMLFNGFKVLATKAKLSQLEKQSQVYLNQQIQNSMAGIMLTYYDIVRQQYYRTIIESTKEISEQKLQIINDRYSVGMANEADVLQAEMDLNMAKQLLNSQEVVIDANKTNLLQLMGETDFYPVTIKDTIVIDQTILKDTILNALESNLQYQAAMNQVLINQQVVREVGAQRYPSIRINGGYNYSRSDYSAGNTLLSQTQGPIVGASLQIPIFNGTIYSRQQKVARFNVMNAQLQKESVYMTLKGSVEKSYQAYQTALEQLKEQIVAYQKAEKLVALMIQRFELNQSTILDLKAAQNSLENTGYVLVNLQYSAKVAEIELKRLAYRLGY